MLIPVFVVVAVVAFSILHTIPGNPAAIMLGIEATTEEIEQKTKELGLDRPILEQFINWSANLVKGDFGYSYYINMPVLDIILEKMPVTLSLAILAELLAVLMGIPLGVLSATKHNTVHDQLFMTIAVLGVSTPTFWVAIMFILVFSVILGWFPSQGYVSISGGVLPWIKHLTLPAVALGTHHSALIARMTRSSMLEVLSADYIRTLRSKGLDERNVYLSCLCTNDICLRALQRYQRFSSEGSVSHKDLGKSFAPFFSYPLILCYLAT